MAGFGIGQAVLRVEDQRFLTGRGQYVDDITLPRMAHMAVVYSSHAHAKIISVDISAAEKGSGVLAVLTGADVEADGLGGLPPIFMPQDAGGPPGYATKRPILIKDVVRCVGDRIAIVIAETADLARDAADLIDVEYEPLPAVVNPKLAMQAGAPIIWPDCPNNKSFTLAFGDANATQAAFDRAAHRVALDIENKRLYASPLEPRCSLADYRYGSEPSTLYTGSQNPHGVRLGLAKHVFALPQSAFRVVSPDVGGGFGMKADTYPEDALVMWASKRLGRPIKWLATRSESFMSDLHGRDQMARAEMALDSKGRALALRVESWHALGAYIAAGAAAPVNHATVMLPGVYDFASIDVRSNAVFTNCSPTGPYRGAGRPEACFILERLMDEAAHQLGMDPVEIRRKNLLKSSAMPHTTPTFQTYDSGEFEHLMDECLELADWNGFEARRAQSEEKGLLRGRAVTCYIENAGIFNESMGLRFDNDGGVAILAGTHSHGQGHATVFPQLIHEWLGIPYHKISLVQGDTDKVSFGRGTYAARSSMLASTALRDAADKVIAKGRVVAAKLLACEPDDIAFSAGVFEQLNRPEKTLRIEQVVGACFSPVGDALGLSVVGYATSKRINYPNGAHVCEVDIDPETGVVKIDRYCVVDDVGKALNPLICEGQIVGGIAQGLGQALLESIFYDPKTGGLVTGSYSDYGLPKAELMPKIESRLAQVPCTTNPVGVKGVGESGTIGAPPTVLNAALDALRPLGVKNLTMPLTSYRVWDAIDKARQEGIHL